MMKLLCVRGKFTNKLQGERNMMNMTRSRLFSAFAMGVVFFIVGCASMTQYGKLEESARDYSARGDYDNAVLQVVMSLQLKPDYDKSQALIKDVFPRAVDEHLGKIKTAKSSSAKFKWDTVAAEYQALIKINRAVKSLPALMDEGTKQPIHFDIQDYTQDLVEPTNNAAEDHYQEGRRLFGKEGMASRDQAAGEFSAANKYVPGYKDATTLAADGYYREGLLLAKADDVDIQKKAAKAFKTAQEFVAGYKDSAALYEKARRAGVKRIAIIPFENKSGKGGYGDIAEAIVDGTISDVMGDSSATEFLEIVSRDQLEQVMREQRLGTTGFFDEKTVSKLGKILGVKEIVTGKITQVTASRARETQRNIPQSKRICVQVDDKRHCVQEEEISAMVTVYNRTAGATITGSYNVIDVKTAAVKLSKSMEGKYAFNASWAKYSGNQDAISGEPGQLTGVSETFAPEEEEMVNMARKDLVEKLSRSFKDYAR